MTLHELKNLVETNAINLHGPVTIVDDCVTFCVREMSDFDVRAFVRDDNSIVEICDDFEYMYESGDAYAKFLRCDDDDAMK